MNTNRLMFFRYLKALLILFLLFSQTTGNCQNSNINSYAVFDDSVRTAGQTGGFICIQNIDTLSLIDIQVIVCTAESDSSIYNAVFSYASGVGFICDKDNIRIEVASSQPAPWTYF